MDIVVLVATSILLIVAVGAIAILLVRWRRSHFRFNMRAMLLACAIIGCTLFIVLRFVCPLIAHRLAIQHIYNAGGAFLFRADQARLEQGDVYSKRHEVNTWGAVLIVHADGDHEALAVARQLHHLPEARSLFLGSNVTDVGLAAIGDSGANSSLTTIDFLQSPITATGLPHLAKLPQLEYLFFNTCPINDSDLRALASIPTLRRLTLLEEGPPANPKRFSERGFEALGQMKSLEHLWFAHVAISDAAADALTNLDDLKTLKLSRCQISDQAVTELREMLPNCDIQVFRDETPADDE